MELNLPNRWYGPVRGTILLLLLIPIVSTTDLRASEMSERELVRLQRSLTAADFARPTKPISPMYPDSVWSEDLDVNVLLRFSLNEKGTADTAEVVYCTWPGKGFEAAALEACQKTEFSARDESGGESPNLLYILYRFFASGPQGIETDANVLVDEPAEMLYKHAPIYSRLAEIAGITGTVWVECLVSKGGQALKAGIYRSSGSDLLDQAALEAASKCKFKPAAKEGIPVSAWVAWKYEFVL